MSCVRGCCETQAEHYRSLRVASPDRESMQKVTTDDHGTHTVDVTEHWQDRQDVHVKNLPTIRVKMGTQQ
jgi:hypothetical protein